MVFMVSIASWRLASIHSPRSLSFVAEGPGDDDAQPLKMERGRGGSERFPMDFALLFEGARRSVLFVREHAASRKRRERRGKIPTCPGP